MVAFWQARCTDGVYEAVSSFSLILGRELIAFVMPSFIMLKYGEAYICAECRT